VTAIEEKKHFWLLELGYINCCRKWWLFHFNFGW